MMTSFFLSTKSKDLENSLEEPTSRADDRPMVGQERSEDDNNNDGRNNTPPRRGRSASMGGDDDDHQALLRVLGGSGTTAR